jgi:hypothetical protein
VRAWSEIPGTLRLRYGLSLEQYLIGFQTYRGSVLAQNKLTELIELRRPSAFRGLTIVENVHLHSTGRMFLPALEIGLPMLGTTVGHYKWL